MATRSVWRGPSISRGVLLAAACLSFPGEEASSAEVGPTSPELQVNTYTPGAQARPAVTMTDDGGFVVVWQSYRDGSQFGVFAQRYDSSGSPQGAEFQVNTHTVLSQRFATVATTADDGFVAAWSSNQQDGAISGIFARRADSSGVLQGVEFQVNTYTPGSQAGATIAMSSTGSYVVVWQSLDQDGDGYGIFAQRFGSTGLPVGGEFQINASTDGGQYEASAALRGTDFLVVWADAGLDGDSAGVFGRRFDLSSGPVGAEFQVNVSTEGPQQAPLVAFTSPDGDFVVAWRGRGYAIFDSDIFLRRYDSSGAAIGGEIVVNEATALVQFAPKVALFANGAPVVTFESNLQDGSDNGIFARGFDSLGAAVGSEIQISTYTMGIQANASIASDAQGRFVVAWQSEYQDGDEEGVFVRTFGLVSPTPTWSPTPSSSPTPTPTSTPTATPSATATLTPSITPTPTVTPTPEPLALDIDDDGETLALTDGLLILRFLFGFTGSALTTGVVGPDCNRCDAASILPYLTGLGATLDVDGDGVVGALTDGLLILRFLFGFTGSALTTGVVGPGCTRCDPAAIETYLQSVT